MKLFVFVLSYIGIIVNRWTRVRIPYTLSKKVIMQIPIKDINATLVYPIDGTTILLSQKLKKIGAGLINGFGGKPKADDENNLRRTACRELYEETGEGLLVDESNLTPRAVIRIFFFENTTKTPDWCFLVYTAKHWKGDAKPTEEMGMPEPYLFENIPFKKMMPADKYFLPRILSEEPPFIGTFYYDAAKTAVIKAHFEKADLEI